MFKSAAYILNPLFLLVSWCIFFYWQKYLWLWVVLAVLAIIITAVLVSGYNFFRYKLQWLNFILIYLGQLSFLLLLKNSVARYTLAVVIALLWSFTWWMLKQHFKNIPALRRDEYLAFKKYWYILNLWFFASSVYSLIIFLSLDFYYLGFFVVIFIYCLTKDLFRSLKLSSFIFWPPVLFLSAQLFLVVYFLPVSFYVAGALIVLWFYYFIILLEEERRSIKSTFLVVMIVTLFLLLSSLYIIL